MQHKIEKENQDNKSCKLNHKEKQGVLLCFNVAYEQKQRTLRNQVRENSMRPLFKVKHTQNVFLIHMPKTFRGGLSYRKKTPKAVGYIKYLGEKYETEIVTGNIIIALSGAAL